MKIAYVESDNLDNPMDTKEYRYDFENLLTKIKDEVVDLLSESEVWRLQNLIKVQLTSNNIDTDDSTKNFTQILKSRSVVKKVDLNWITVINQTDDAKLLSSYILDFVNGNKNPLHQAQYLYVAPSNYKIKQVLDNKLTKEIIDVHDICESLDRISSFKDREKWMDERFLFLGKGTSRSVYQVTENKVLKLAINKFGLSQNSTEADYYYSGTEFTTNTHIADSDDKYLISEFATSENLKSQQGLKKIISEQGVDWWDFFNYVTHLDSINLNSYTGLKLSVYDEMQKIEIKYLDKDGELNPLLEFMKDVSYNGLMLGDFTRFSSWGFVKTEDGKTIPKIKDFGLTESNYKEFVQSKHDKLKEKENSDTNEELNMLKKVFAMSICMSFFAPFVSNAQSVYSILHDVTRHYEHRYEDKLYDHFSNSGEHSRSTDSYSKTQLPSSPTSLGNCAVNLYNGQQPSFSNASSSYTRETQLICYPSYALMASGITKTGIWSAEYLTPTRISETKEQKRVNSFHPDTNLPQEWQAQLSDYTRSGYDRGHMSPSGDQPSAETQNDSFSLANMAPQAPKFNRGVWAHLEESVRSLASSDSVYVVTGLLFRGEQVNVIGQDKVMVPSQYYKAVFDPTKNAASVFWGDNTDDTVIHLETIQQFEQETGIVFHFPENVSPLNLPRAKSYSNYTD